MAVPAAVAASPAVKPPSKYVKTDHKTVPLPEVKTANSAAFNVSTASIYLSIASLSLDKYLIA